MKKRFLARIIFGWFGVFAEPLLFALKRNKYLYVLAYHRISENPGSGYPFEEAAISATPSQFEEQVRFLNDQFHVTTFEALGKAVDSGKEVPENSVIITFDDGYRDNYEIAFEILKKYGMSATVFISTGFIGSDKLFWFEELTYLLKKTSLESIQFDGDKYCFSVKDSNRVSLRRKVMGLFRSVPDGDRVRFMGQLRRQSNVVIPKESKTAVSALSWKQINEMSSCGFEIGSHTVTHPILTNMDEDEVIYELEYSKRIIKENTGKSPLSFAYPAGHYNDNVIECVRKAGYKFALSYRHDVCEMNRVAELAHKIPRIHVETDVSHELFKGNILMPRIFLRHGFA